MAVDLVTSHGTMRVNLYYKETPKTCRNFIELSRSGYYDGVIFHRVLPGFVAQTGDPQGDGKGGESIYGPFFEDEIVATLGHDRKGVVSMANAGRNTNSSQFFLTFDALPQLDGKHTVFGYVTEDTIHPLTEIEIVKCKNKTPVKPIKIFTVEIIEDPWKGQPLPYGASIPEKPLMNEQKKCIIQ